MILLSGGELCKEKLSKESCTAIHSWYTNKTLSEVSYFKSDKSQFFQNSSLIQCKKKFALLMFLNVQDNFMRHEGYNNNYWVQMI